MDTNVWVRHLRQNMTGLSNLLMASRVVVHPAVTGELVLGGLADRHRQALSRLPAVLSLSDDEVLRFVDKHRLQGHGIGWVDSHLLGAALTSGLSLWTLDRKLDVCATRLGVTRP